ncbi:MAG: hypothetical protein KF832_32155 [Caldilineaceae bacterium]|nr:hypothetical protein [Caldilineaceae bacterium]
MSDSGSKQVRIKVSIALMVTGFGIGWLAGLSVSPVISIVITSITGSVATIIAALSGAKEELLDKDATPTTLKRLLQAVTPMPLAWLVAGLIVGSGTGIWMRTHNWLSPNPPEPPPALSLQEEVTQWEALGLPREDVVRGLFEQRILSKDNKTQSANTTSGILQASSTSPRDTVLFTISQNECTEMIERSKSDTEPSFRRYLSVKPHWQQLEMAITDDTVLKEVVAALCTSGG